MLSKVGRVEKTWGYEEIIFSNEFYCSKHLVFEYGADENKTSMHFHKDKHETWKVVLGKFLVRYINCYNGQVFEHELNVGDTWQNEPLTPHQLIAIDGEGVVLETSTPDYSEDNYRLYR